ncbi:MAG: PKD domain-containing protein [Bacteroidota bacterium]
MVFTNPTPIVQAQGATTFCPGDSVGIATQASYASYLWSTGQTDSLIFVSVGGITSVTVTDANGCQGTGNIILNQASNPTPNISPSGPTTFCEGSSVQLDAGNFNSYSWNTGATSQTLQVDSTGWYVVTVTNLAGCKATDSLFVQVNENPTPQVQPNGTQLICPGSTLLLDAGNFDTYLWSTGAITQTTTVSTAGIFSVSVVDTNGCRGTDSMRVALFVSPMPSITLSGSSSICQGDSVTLIASMHASYLWSTGETSRQITVSTGGTYSVTVLDTNGCSGSAQTTINLINNPTPTITPLSSTTFCEGDSVRLDAGIYSTYLWSTGETSRRIVANTSGNYGVEVTNANGCKGYDTIQVIANPNPVPSIVPSGPTTFCAGTSVNLDAGNFDSYLWSTGATSQSITVTATGTYIVTVTDTNLCQASDTLQVRVNNNPTPSVTAGAPSICPGDSTQLTTGAFSSYLWSTGETTQSIFGGIGTFQVTVTDANGCQGTAQTTIAAAPVPNPNIQVLPSASLCPGDSAILDAGVYSSYAWSTGATNSRITVFTGGNYVVTVTNSDGCEGADTVTIVQNNNPTPIISSTSGNVLCPGTSTSLSTAPYVSYLWSNGASTPSISVFTGGTFTVTVQDTNGCRGIGSIQVTSVSNPSPTIVSSGPPNVCPGSSLGLSTGAFSSWLWSNGDTTQATSISAPGNYSVLVTDGNGCQGTDTLSISASPNLSPSISPSGNITICTGGSVTLDAGTYDQYSWSNGDTTQTILVTQPDTFVVTVFDVSGCSGIDTVVVDSGPNLTPQIVALSSLDFCQGDSVILDAGIYNQYLWSTGETSRFITLKTATTVNVEVTDANFCTGRDTVTSTIFANPSLAIVPLGPTAFCPGDSVGLEANATFNQYNWSTGAVSSQITANAGGLYILQVQDSNGCRANDSILITINPNPQPNITTNTGANDFCNGDSLTLDAGSYSLYQWSTGETSRQIVVKQAGTYFVEVTDANGCTGTDSIDIIVNPLPSPNITPNNPTLCVGSTFTLDAGPYNSYLWSTFATTRTITGSNPGIYSVLVTDSNGCRALGIAVVNSVNNPTPTISPGPNVEICQGDTANLATTLSYASYLWSTGDTTPTIGVQNGGSYWVRVTNPSGCEGFDTVSVSVKANPNPNISPNGPTAFCPGDSVTLDAGPFQSYVWSTGETSRSITVDSAGTFTVTVTNVNNCSGSDIISTSLFTPPVATITPQGSTSICEGSSLILDGGSFAGYLWNTGELTQSIVVDSIGWYSLTVTNNNGCQDTDSIFVTVNPNPTPVITPSGGSFTICQGGSVELDAGTYSSYFWTPTGFNGQRLLTTTGGLYTVQVTDANGCQGTANATVTVVNNPSPSIVPIGPTTFCQGDSITLSVGAYAFYNWSNGGSTQNITVSPATSRIYTVVVTDANGCIGSDAIAVTVNQNPQPSIVNSGPLSFCQGNSVTLDVDPGQVFQSYQWSTGATTPAIVVVNSGTYSVEVNDANGCSGSDTVTVQVNPLPVARIKPQGPTIFCPGDSVILDAAGQFAGYSWNTGSVDSILTVKTSGLYFVEVTDQNGCTDRDSIQVRVLPNANIQIQSTGPTTFCEGGSVTFFVTGSFPVYSWNTGQNGAAITVDSTGLYQITVTDTNGCSFVDTQSLQVFPLPNATISTSSSLPYCQGDTLILAADSASSGSSFLWSNSAVTQQISTTGTGLFHVLVTDSNGCQDRDTLIVIQSPPLNVTIQPNGPVTFCDGDSVALIAGTSPYNQYQWSTGDTFAVILAKVTGAYSVTVTDTFGCSAQDTISINILPNPVFSLAASGPTFFCEGDSVVLSPTAFFPSYQWNTGDTTLGIKVDSGGLYTLTVTDTNGCSSSRSRVVTVNPNPVPSLSTISGRTALCSGNFETLQVGGGPYANYLWSTGATSSTINVFVAGTYWVEVTNSNGCVGSDTLQLAPSIPLNPQLRSTTSTTICQGDSVELVVTGTFQSYSWSNLSTSTFISTDSSIVIADSGLYTVIVTDSNLCTGADTLFISESQGLTPSIITLGGQSTTFCQGDSAILDPGPFDTYVWNTGETTRTIVTKSTGTYSVIVRDTLSGCDGIATDSITVLPVPTDTITVTGNKSFCEGDSVFLYAGLYAVQWISPVQSNNVLLKVKTSGTYVAVRTNTFGCADTESVQIFVNQNPTPVIAPVSGPPLLCNNQPTVLSAGNFSNYLWSTQSATPTISADTAGLYTVLVTDNNGCSGTDSLRIDPGSSPRPVISPQGDSLCSQTTIQLRDTVGGWITYSWSNGDTTSRTNYSQITQVPQVFNLVLTVTDSLGCPGKDSVGLAVFPLPEPDFGFPGGLNVCNGDSVYLTPGVFSKYSWSLPGTGGARGDTTAQVLVDSTGTYFVQVEDSNGCKDITQIFANVRQTTFASFTGLGGPYCDNDQPVQLLGNPSGGTFTGPGINSVNGLFDPIAAGPGVHEIKYYFTNGAPNFCTDTARQWATVFPVSSNPTIGPSLANVYCDNDTAVLLSATPQGGMFTGLGVSQVGNNYLFDPAVAGSGQVTVTYSFSGQNGCQATTSRNVQIQSTSAVQFSGLDSSYCLNASADSLIPQGALNNGVFSGSGLLLRGNTVVFEPDSAGPGMHIITYQDTSANGCISFVTDTAFVQNLPSLNISLVDSNFCELQARDTLIATPGGGTFFGNGVSNNQFTPSLAGIGPHTITYSLTTNGCTDSLIKPIQVVPNPTASFVGLDTAYCTNDMPDTLKGTPNGGQFLGSGIIQDSIFDPSQVTAGSMFVSYVYVDTFGCTDTAIQQVNVNPQTNLSFTGLDSTYCLGEPATSLSGSPVGGIFSGSGVDSLALTFLPDSAGFGSHTVRYTYTNTTTGCTDRLDKQVFVDSLPVIQIDTLGPIFCVESGSFSINVSPTGGFFRGRGIVIDSSGFTTNIYDPQLAGIGKDSIFYRFINANGCGDSVLQIVEIIPAPQLSIQGLDSIYCTISTPDTLQGFPSGGQFVGPGLTGNVFDPTLLDSGFYTLTYIYSDSIGCQDSLSRIVVVTNRVTADFSGLDSSYCEYESTQPLSGFPSGGIFTGPGTDSNRFNPFIAGEGIHTISYLSLDLNGCADTVSKDVVVFSRPDAQLSGVANSYCLDADPAPLSGTPMGGAFFGPGVNGNIFTPQLADTGLHVVSYTVSDSTGCSDTAQQNIRVLPRPLADFEVTDACLNDSAVFLNLSESSTSATYTWVLGDGTVSQDSAPRHQYPAVGPYTVTLTVRNADNCRAFLTKSLEILPVPDAGMINDSLVYLGDTAFFFNNSSGAAAYLWEFGDGNSSVDSLPDHLFGLAGEYQVLLTALTEFGCEDTTQGNVRVERRPVADFKVTIYPNPNEGSFVVNVNVNEGEDVVIYTYDRIGRIVRTNGFRDLPPGLNKLEVDLGVIAEGVYMVAVMVGDDIYRLNSFDVGKLAEYELRYVQYRKLVITR